jgi:predicted AlkP superfamily pyrophosphatase or phosphodiesterase
MANGRKYFLLLHLPKPQLMKQLISFIGFFSLSLFITAQELQRPKLVVGIVVDQMRWDFLYRYSDRYQPSGAFKRLLNGGFRCENTFIPYAPSVTGPGHSTIYTGTVPAIHGIVGNTWWDTRQNKSVYCTEDKTVKTVGSNTSAGEMSPRNLFTTTVTDEMRLASNFRGKVIGIAQKDRGSILCAGHSANAAYWYDGGSGNWITSTWYMNDLPQWVKNFNSKKLVDKYYNTGWNTLYPISTYRHSTSDEKNYEGSPFGKKFPYDLKKYVGNNYEIINTTPFGNTLTLELAKEAVVNEQLGQDADTDFLTIGFSSPDYIGHTFGPNSVEVEDCFLRLDAELGGFFNFLDTKIGKNQYLVFLSSDHGVGHIPGFLAEHKIPGGYMQSSGLTRELNQMLHDRFGVNNLVTGIYNLQVVFNHEAIKTSAIHTDSITRTVSDYLLSMHYVFRVIDLNKIQAASLPEKLKEWFVNGYYPPRCGDLQIILLPQWMDRGGNTGTTHGTWNPYDTKIPLLWYGWKIKPGKLYRQVYMTDIAPTLAALLNIQPPNGNVGAVIEEVLK